MFWITLESAPTLMPLFWAAPVSESCRNNSKRDHCQQAAGLSDCRGRVSETAGMDLSGHLDVDFHLEVYLCEKFSLDGGNNLAKHF